MLIEPNCFKRKCKNFIGVHGDRDKQNEYREETERVYCKAFSDRIPNEIAYGKNKHLKPLKNQKNKIVYERREENT